MKEIGRVYEIPGGKETVDILRGNLITENFQIGCENPSNYTIFDNLSKRVAGEISQNRIMT